MAPSTVQSAQYTGSLAKTKPRRVPGGPTMDILEQTIATTSLDEIGDRVKLIRIPNVCRLFALYFESQDLDSGAGALRANLVVNTAAGDTVLLTGGASDFAAAGTGKWVWCNVAVNDATLNEASIDLLVTAAASTAAAGYIRILALWDY